MATLSLLLTGASGYIGGTILATLLSEKGQWVQNFDISALVRTEAQAAKIRELGAKPVLFSDLDDADHLTSVAERYDVVVHVAAGWHTPSAVALLKGLGARKQRQGSDSSRVRYLHISGVSNICDRPLTAGYVENRTFSDEEDIYSYEKYRESFEVYMQRTTDIAVVETGEALGVETYIVMGPMLFGLGTGPFNRYTIPIASTVEAAKQNGACPVIGDGKSVWSHVHIRDLADLYVVMLRRIAEGRDDDKTMPRGRKGIYFAETGDHSSLEYSQKVAKAGKELRLLATDEVRSVDLEEGARQLTWGMASVAELVYAANARTKAVLGRKLGWNPHREAEWETTVHTELAEYQKNPPPKRDLGSVLDKLEK